MRFRLQFIGFYFYVSFLFTAPLFCQNTEENTFKYPFDIDKLDRLYEKDSLVEARNLLDRALKTSTVNKNDEEIAVIYSCIAVLYEKMGNYKSAEGFYLKSYSIIAKTKNLRKRDVIGHKLASCYLLNKDYSKFDSIYPLALKLSRELNSEYIFKNYDLKKQYFYDSYQFDSIISLTEKAITELENTRVSDLNISSEVRLNPSFKEKLLYEYRLYNAYGLIKMNGENAENEGYHRLLKIENDSLKKYLNSGDISYYRKLSLLNYYKSRFYTLKKQYKEANFYLNLSDGYKYNVVEQYGTRMAKNGELIHATLKNEEKLTFDNEILVKDRQLSRTYKIITLIVTFLLLLLIASVIYYYRSNKKLQQVDKDRFHFFSTLSHELRTPIYGINGLVSVIKSEENEEKRMGYYDTLKISTSYISMLIDNVLQVSRFKFEKKELQFTKMNLNDQLNSIYQSTSIIAKSRQVKIELHISKDNEKETLLIDRVVLSQILINLLHNAIKFTPIGGLIKLGATEIKRTSKDVLMVFEVINTGEGIDYKAVTKDFIPFDKSQLINQNKEGTGLGLDIAQTLLKSYNSELRFRSTKDVDTSFKFSICFTIVPNETKIHVKDTVTNPIGNKALRILVVDDNKLNLIVTKKNVESIKDAICTTVSSGKEAYIKCKQESYDLILMDINMPEMDGYETTKLIKEVNKDVPIIALTALNFKEVNNLAKKSGMLDVITKPYNLNEFKKIILSYC